ncbi:hypothetical protein H9P43_007031 [Blastocladiella emersonii ATCC 22665]|nr:hypothetical protein H9P43_007031 [Blastocladiella emersonii ATCC 22665]
MPPMTDAELLKTSRTMLFLGIPALPLMWLLQIAYVLPHAHIKYATVGVAFWTILFVTWWALFATHRRAWGAFGDALVVVDVKGR